MLRKLFLDWKRDRWFKEMDFKPVTPRQRELLTQMLHHALVEIRSLCWEKKTEQATDLADAFHNLPGGLYSENFSFPWFRRELESYERKYRSPDETQEDWGYVFMLDKAEREEDWFSQAP